WIDLVALRYTVMLSGVTKIILTKADVLDGFEKLQAGVAYKIDGSETQDFPFDITTANLEPVYQSFEGWTKPISECTSYDELPNTFTEYCNFIEQYLGTKIAFISNGTGRDQLLVKPQ
ncbi:MAG: adenylosuccinate synthetase, partial [Chitinophagaceae bacterium]|nr:adenylosuccinate synthetase [Chitinophagaceae bacterium]